MLPMPLATVCCLGRLLSTLLQVCDSVMLLCS